MPNFYQTKLAQTRSCQLGTCEAGECNVCGDGLTRGDEECECASGTDCRFCSNCKLQDGKECTPDATTACCDDEGMFLSTAASCVKGPGGNKGYCSAGKCALYACDQHVQVIGGDFIHLDTFCGVSTLNTCSGKCRESASTTCYDPGYEWGGVLSLDNGSLCTKDGQRGKCLSGQCIPFPVTTLPTTTTTTTPRAPACQSWCTWHHDMWERKCDMRGKCDACPACFGELAVQVIIFWCVDATGCFDELILLLLTRPSCMRDDTSCRYLSQGAPSPPKQVPKCVPCFCSGE